MAARGSGNVTARAQRRGRPFSSPRSPRHGECCAQASASMKAVSASMKAVSASMITSDGARKPRSIHILPFPRLSARFRLEQQGAYLPYTGISRVIKDRHPSRQGSPFRPLSLRLEGPLSPAAAPGRGARSRCQWPRSRRNRTCRRGRGIGDHQNAERFWSDSRAQKGGGGGLASACVPFRTMEGLLPSC